MITNEEDKPRPGIKNCLKCSKPFSSWDVRKNWICPKCTKSNENEYIPKSIKSKVYISDTEVKPIELPDNEQ